MKSFTTLLLLLFLSVVCACTERIDLVSEGIEPQLAITGTLSTEAGYQYIEVYETQPYFGTDLPTKYDISYATINDVKLTRVARGTYTLPSNFAAVEGETYTLKVYVDYNKDGEEECYWATTTVPYTHELESLSLEAALATSKPNIPFFLIMGFNDTVGNDYYGASLYINGDLYSNRILRYYVHSFTSTSQDGTFLHFPITDWIIMSSLTWDNGATYDLYCGDKLTVELQTLSKEYYNYLKDAKTEKSQQFPLFSGPRGNVRGNIQGGALGIFGSYTVSRRSVIIPDCDGLPKR